MSAASRQQAAAGRINPNWLHYGAAALLGAIVLGNVLRWGILGQYPASWTKQDQLRMCRREELLISNMVLGNALRNRLDGSLSM
jgi:hypothetical protein